jgi:hypothetical protein
MTEDGGGVFFYPHVHREEPWTNVNKFLDGFGVQFGPYAKKPYAMTDSEIVKGLDAPGGVSYTLEFAHPDEWTILAKDADGKPVAAARKVGKGRMLVFGMNLIGPRSQKDGPLFCQDLVHEMFRWVSAGKDIVPGETPAANHIYPEQKMELGAVVLHYNQYLAEYADKVGEYYKEVKPLLRKWMGVPLKALDKSKSAQGQLHVYLLPCGDWAWSGGDKIGVAVFWGNFPEVPIDVIGVLAHELQHSWMHGYTENFNAGEAIAIYAGYKVLHWMGYEDTWKRFTEGLDKKLSDEKFAEWRKQDYKKDPTNKYIVAMWGIEKKYGEQTYTKYVQTRDKLAPPSAGPTNDSDGVWLWSRTTGEDMFPYFRSLGYDVDPSKVQLPAAKEALQEK